MNARRKLFFFGKGGVAPAPVGLLNTTEGAGAAFAISLRMLNTDLIGQDAIEVKRVANSDFDRFPLAANGVPLSDIASFCGASDGIVPWILDQSGNGFHAQQEAEAQAMKIYKDGAIVTENGRPALLAEGNQGYLMPAIQIGNTPFIYVYNMFSTSSIIGSQALTSHYRFVTGERSWMLRLADDTIDVWYSTGGSSNNRIRSNSIVEINSPTLAETQIKGMEAINIDRVKIFKNGKEVLVNDIADTSGPGNIAQATEPATIGAIRSSSASAELALFFQGKFQETVGWAGQDKDLDGSRVIISNNVKSHYAIS